ncbi:hypothetical protein O9G_006320 [Rozella allomycis CSF55]|uniref:Uncharacterized protein n=1 Tax=Rozella allomycis (strain CSF55) TaxID=988480 RepID=A0A075B116_ROZAC|nr:hypothetical protein O9G_006320 [Rozella allomycis CSF55]|eukprot:EPZ34626.1 hypothetical protein O9G_006320 [Rozella allomycis CSF55]
MTHYLNNYSTFYEPQTNYFGVVAFSTYANYGQIIHSAIQSLNLEYNDVWVSSHNLKNDHNSTNFDDLKGMFLKRLQF